MGRSRKRQHRLPSIIDSDMDRTDRSSHHDNDSSGSDSLSDSSIVPTDRPTGTGSVTGKRSKGRKKTKTQVSTAPVPASKVDYILSLFSAIEMKKPAAKHEPKKSSLQLPTDEPWDTVKAQLLVKIDDLLKPSTLSIDDYEILFSIPRVVSKPGYPLASATDYAILLERSCKSKLVQLSISTVVDHGNKENEEADNGEKLKKKKGRTDPATLPGNVKKAANIRTLQERCKCAKQTPDCLGTYCFVNNEGTHLPLSHERLDCWAAAMVCFFFILLFHLLIYHTAFRCYHKFTPESSSLRPQNYQAVPCPAMSSRCAKPGSSHSTSSSDFQLHHR